MSSSNSTLSYSSIVRASSGSSNTTPSPNLKSRSISIPKKESNGNGSKSSNKKMDDVKSILPVAALSEVKGRKVCSFFLQGICRYGQQCRHRHLHCVSDKCLSCGLTVGSTSEEQQAHLSQCSEVMAMEKERRDSASRKCGICHQLTLKLNRKFGLLISCTHSFCLQCIREWRGSSEHSRERVRACPLCKVVSHYVIPCDRHVAEPSRKQRVIAEYKYRLQEIDCKHYNRGKSVCPFGEACFYRHEETPSVKSKAHDPLLDDDDDFENDYDKNFDDDNEEQKNKNNNTNHDSVSSSRETSYGRRSSGTSLKFTKKSTPLMIKNEKNKKIIIIQMPPANMRKANPKIKNK